MIFIFPLKAYCHKVMTTMDEQIAECYKLIDAGNRIKRPFSIHKLIAFIITETSSYFAAWRCLFLYALLIIIQKNFLYLELNR